MPRAKQATDIARSVRSARLRYVDPREPGIRRVRSGKGFRYVGPAGGAVRGAAALARIQLLAIPPAWENVWICRDARGHLQATGTDARGRRQYLYHAQWRAVRDEAKYEKTVEFARQLSRIRRGVARDLRKKRLSREKVLAAIVRLLETTHIRVGSEEYASQNGSFGLTTMVNRHVRVNHAKIRFAFPGKSGIRHAIDLSDGRLAKIVRRCQQLPGQQLFQYVDDTGRVSDIKSTDVNDYLRQLTGQDFTAKDFRTWSGTALAAQALQEFGEFDSTAAGRRNVKKAIERVAERLGNTVAICRKCYVHPAVIDAYLDHTLGARLPRHANRKRPQSRSALSANEAAVLALLQNSAKASAKKQR